MKKYYNIELSKKDTFKLIDFLSKNDIYFENNYIDSKYCHTEILLEPEDISLVNNFLDTL